MKEKDYLMNEKIFISIPCWRDPFIINTIESAIANAYFPNNLVFGVVFQGYDEDLWIIEKLKNIPANIKIIFIDGKDTPIFLTKIKGEIALSQMTDEKYYMQIDAHNKFKLNWDIGLMAELLIATQRFGKSIIGPQIEYFDKWAEEFSDGNHTAVPDEKQFINLGESFSADKFPIAVNGKILDKPNNMMIKERFYNGNCIFAYADYAREVTQPPNHTINYEQQIMMLRIFTAGYNIVSPIHAYSSCFNFWTNNPNADTFVRHTRANDNIWKEKFIQADLQSRKDYYDVIENNIIDFTYGMYNARTLSEYIDFIGYDPATLKLTRAAKMLENNNFTFVSDEEFQEALDTILANQ